MHETNDLCLLILIKQIHSGREWYNIIDTKTDFINCPPYFFTKIWDKNLISKIKS